MRASTMVAGEKALVDYSGKRIGIVDPTTGEIREAEIFVGVLGGLEPPLCRGDLDADIAGLDRCRRAHVSVSSAARLSFWFPII